MMVETLGIMMDHRRAKPPNRALHEGMLVKFDVIASQFGHVDLLEAREAMLEQNQLP